MDSRYYWWFFNLTSVDFYDDRHAVAVGTSGKIITLGEVATSLLDGQTYFPQYSLEQNYPNPFNPSTTFKFSISSSSFVSLKIFDLLGREISSLVLEKLREGVHSVKWDATAFAGGTYFYRLQAGAFSETKKLIIIR